MKKLIVGLLTAFLLSGGLVVITSGTASAVCPYTGCVPTEVVTGQVSDSAKPGKVRAKFRVRTVGNAVPKGQVRIILKGNGEYRSRTVAYPGTSGVSFFRLPKGTYQVTIKFIPAAGTAFGRTSETSRVRVR
jgi:hypothetical protein